MLLRPAASAALAALCLLGGAASGLSAQVGTSQGATGGQQAEPQPVDPLSLPRPTLAAHFVEDAPMSLDGRLDEPIWSSADSTIGPMWLSLPRQGLPQQDRTMVRILQVGDELWVGAILYEPEMDRVVTSGLEQDFETTDSPTRS